MKPTDLAILFADICGSTSLADRADELEAVRSIDACLTVISREITDHRGRIVKHLGDGLLAVFPDGPSLVTATVAAFRRLRSESELQIHCGGSFGRALVSDSGDVFGDVVNVSARVQHLAGPGRLYVTDAVAASITEPPDGVDVRRVGAFDLKGKEERIEVFEVVWQREDATTIFRIGPAAQALQVELRHAGQSHLLEGKASLVIGRSENDDIVIPDPAASRRHAVVSTRGGHARLQDQSTNGTFVQRAGRSLVRVHHEEIALEGEGTIALGRADGPPVEFVVRGET